VLAGRLGVKGLGAVCVSQYTWEYLARLEVGFARVPRRITNMLFVLFANSSAPLDRFLKDPSNTTNPHRVFDEGGGRIAVRHYSRSSHVSITRQNAGYWKTLAVDYRLQPSLVGKDFTCDNHRAEN
jgi:hypothetical protein